MSAECQALIACVLFDSVYSHRPGAPYGDRRIGINHTKSSGKEQLRAVRKH